MIRSKFLRDEVIRLYQEGYSTREVTDMLPVEYGEVYGILKHKGLLQKKIKRTFDEIEKEVCELYKEGFAIKEIAKKVYSDTAGVARVLTRQGLLKPLKKPKNEKKPIQPTTEDMVEMLEKYNNGKSVKDIAKEYGWSKQTIYQYLRSRKPETSKRLTKINSRKIIELYKKGCTILQIASELSISSISVYGKVKDSEQYKKQKEQKKEEVDRMVCMFKAGMSVEQISKELNISRAVVYTNVRNREEYIDRLKQKKAEINKIEKMLKTGASVKQITKELNCQPSRVYNTLYRNLKKNKEV